MIGICHSSANKGQTVRTIALFSEFFASFNGRTPELFVASMARLLTAFFGLSLSHFCLICSLLSFATR